MHEALPSFSIVICTYNRKIRLKKCLESVFELCYPRNLFEVIVVDGGSTDGTAELVRKEFSMVRLIVENKPGLSHARNVGARNANGDIIAFTDDDCIVDKLWLRALASGFSCKDIMGVGGPVYPLYPQLISSKLLVEGAFGLYNPGNEYRHIDKLIGANFAFKREAFDIASFDTDLGRKGSRLFSLEDLDFCWKLRERGYGLLYVPTAIVYHDVDPSRIKFGYILKRAIYEGKSLSVVLLKKKKPLVKLTGSLIVSSFTRLFRFVRKRSLNLFYKWLSEVFALLFLITLILVHRKKVLCNFSLSR